MEPVLEVNLDFVDYLVFVLYLVSVLTIAFFVARKKHTTALEYFVARRALP